MIVGTSVGTFKFKDYENAQKYLKLCKKFQDHIKDFKVLYIQEELDDINKPTVRKLP